MLFFSFHILGDFNEPELPTKANFVWRAGIALILKYFVNEEYV